MKLKLVEKLPFSLVVVAGDEEAQIERCLRSVPFADEILVVDSYSKDRTVEIAQSCGARVIQEKWRGYGPQKRFAVENAKNDWVLCLDADECLSPELAEELRRRFRGFDPYTAYAFARKSFHLGRWILHGGWFPDWQLRLFHRKNSQWSDSAIHERVVASREERIQQPILHYVFDHLSDQVRTNDRYSSLQAEALFQRGEKFRLDKLLFKPFVKFLENYLLKRGFLDGLPGFIIAISSGYSVFLKYAKLWELQKGKKTS